MQLYRDEHVRESLHKYVRQNVASMSDAVVIDELTIQRKDGRVDLAVITDYLHAYEIKSEADKLSKLKGQVKMYSKVFDYLSVVVDEKHLAGARKIVPKFWGVLVWTPFTLKTGTSLVQAERHAVLNVDISKKDLSQLLWKDNALELLKSVDAHKGLSATPKYLLWGKVEKACSTEQIHAAVIEQYKNHRRLDRAG